MRPILLFPVVLALALLPACDRSGTGPEHPAEISLSRTELVLNDGAVDTLTASVKDAAGDVLDRLPSGASVTWSSSDTTVIAVQQGVVTARHPGQAEVSASVGTLRASARVTVKAVATGVEPVGDTLRTAVTGRAGDTLVVRVVDRHREGVPGVEVEFTVAAGGGAVSPVKATSDAAGLVRAVWSPGAQPGGPQRVEARVTGASFPAVRFTSPLTFLFDRFAGDTTVSTPFPTYAVYTSGFVTGAYPLRQVSYSLDGGADIQLSTQVLSSSPRQTFYSLTLSLPLGTHALRVTAVDTAGNVGRWQRTITVQDLPSRSYSVRFLGGLGGDDAAPLDLNENGDVVGWALLANGDTTAAVWRGGSAASLGGGLGAWSRATGINGTGEVVGQFREGSCARSFRWSEGTRTAFEGCGLSAVDVSDRGSVLFQENRVLRDGSMIDLAAVVGQPIFPTGGSFRLNRDDAVLALYWPFGGGCGGGFCSYGPLVARAPYGAANTTVKSYGGFPVDLNDRGDVVGTCSGGSGQGSCAGYVHLADGTAFKVDWPVVSGTGSYNTRGSAYAINAGRQVVGMAGQTGQAALFPYLWEGGTVYRIRVTAPEWVVDGVAEINDRGVVAAHARNTVTGQKGVVLLTPG